MEDTRYTAALANALCATASGIALRCITKYPLATKFPIWAFGYKIGCCLFGALAYGIPQLQQLRPYYDTIHFILHCFVVPLLSTHFSHIYGYDSDLSLLQVVFPIIPLVAHLLKDKNQHTLLDVIVGSTLVFKSFMHYQQKNYYGLAYCLSYAINHFIIKIEGNIGDVPSLEVHLIGSLFSIFFAIKSLYS